ncbi:MAG: nuclear transport factor 2 family protein [Ferruginibacter sp.]|nr:nuclear transport factor 2 family protein [Bacteroidota bacterium]MCW5916270.1 nuclear transport factor 2 family protein [Ferruginibacter sp.]
MKRLEQRKAQLKVAYQCVMKVSILDRKAPLRYINQYIAEDVCGFGTAADEKVESREEYRNVIIKSRQQSRGLYFKAKNLTPYHPKFIDEDTAQFHNEMVVQIGDRKNIQKFHLWFSVVFKYRWESWQMVLFHGSIPDAGSSMEETFLLGEAAQRLKELEQVVAQRTMEIQNKNRELEIEAGLERVRSRSMAMHQTSELQDVIQTVHKELLNLKLSIDGGSFIVINKDIDSTLCCWGSGGTANTSEEFVIPHFNMPFVTNLVKGIKRRKSFFSEEFSQKEKKEFFTKLFKHKPWSKLSSKRKKETLSAPGGYTRSVAVSQHTSIFIINHQGKKFSDTENDILKRFAKVFEQTYIRFLDLQKAEAQAREAQIQLALERVRARTMAMHASDELAEVAVLLFEQVKKLGIAIYTSGFNIWDNEKENVVSWMSNPNGEVNPPLPMNIHDSAQHLKTYNAWKSHELFFENDIKGQALKKHYRYLHTLPSYRGALIKSESAGIKTPARMIHNIAFFKQGYLLFITLEPCPKFRDIYIRFAKVFEQTYTRFLDLQKAEAQAREAQIEAALEKVRSRSLAMHKSDELKDVIRVVLEQFVHLNIKAEHAGFYIDYKAQDDMHIWLADPNLEPFFAILPYFDTPTWNSFLNAKKKGIALHTDLLDFKEKNKFYRSLFKLFEVPEEAKKFYMECKGLAVSTVLLDNVGLYIENFSAIPYTDEENNILLRFGNVFQQTYTRFLDLQKAEAQAREAQVEAALEKVRSRSLAMHKSDEIGEVVWVVIDKMKDLGIDAQGISIATFMPGSKDIMHWHANAEIPGKATTMFMPWFDDLIYNDCVNARNEGMELLVKQYSKEEKNRYIHAAVEHSDFKYFPKELIQWILERPCLSFSYAIQKHTGIFLEDYEGRLFSKEENNILIRFSKVFEQAYIRFLDLQKAEAQTREAQIEAALERVRSKTMAMQKSGELADAISVLFQQLILLGIEPSGFYLAIMQSDAGKAEFWISEEAGTGVSTAYQDNLNNNPVFSRIFDRWKKQDNSLILDLQGAELQEYLVYLNCIHIPYKEGSEQIRSIQYIAFFSRGFIGLASPVEQPEGTIQLLERFAAVFNLTFTRFNDLKVAEEHSVKAAKDLIEIKEARKKAEETLVELQATQKQLIQSEKMASLGELTAGIAHEIQNPLNFVNNFSEVSTELLVEMKVAIEKGDSVAAQEIMTDVVQNLEKINYHGKRADAIVKGMLQHSRTSSGQMEPTDINVLCDEYLRLSYHGLRAKDKSFNAEFVANLDPLLPNINVVPQEIGRVLLNIINNAFYAVSERKKLGEPGFQPTVKVSTQQKNKFIIITVKDNGIGIPATVVEKIFQPFFTTKPTGEGTGLGLSLSYDIVKAHEGTLEVTSKEGEGTEFVIQLPV